MRRRMAIRPSKGRKEPADLPVFHVFPSRLRTEHAGRIDDTGRHEQPNDDQCKLQVQSSVCRSIIHVAEPPVFRKRHASSAAPSLDRPTNHYVTSITTMSPPPPCNSALLFVVWCGIWQWISHLPGWRAFQITS